MSLSRAFDTVHQVAACSAAGIVAGVIAAAAGRLAMRISGALSDPALIGVAHTENGNVVGAVTLDGTFALIVFTGLAGGALGGLLYYLVLPLLSRLGRRGGIAFGLALLAIGGASVFSAALDFRRFGPPLLNVVMFIALFPLYGWLVTVLAERLELLTRRRGLIANALVAAGLLGVLGAIWTAGLLVAFALAEPRTDPSRSAEFLLLAALALAAVARWPARGSTGAYAPLAVPLAIGALLTVRLIGEILS